MIAVIGPWIAPYDPDTMSNELLQPPSGAHWFGTTQTGQDVLSQILVGTRGVLVVGFVAGIFATILSVLIGVSAGFLGGTADELLSVLSNVFLVIPGLPLIIIIASFVSDAGDLLIATVIAFTSWAWGRASCAPRRCRCAAGTTSKRLAPPASPPGGSSSSRSCRI